MRMLAEVDPELVVPADRVRAGDWQLHVAGARPTSSTTSAPKSQRGDGVLAKLDAPAEHQRESNRPAG